MGFFKNTLKKNFESTSPKRNNLRKYSGRISLKTLKSKRKNATPSMKIIKII